jgi:pimeloyl-ACP methyl ester carboxylesterase
VLRRYSFGDEHITDVWVRALAAVAATPKYKEAAIIVERSSYAADLQREKGETFDLIRTRGIGKPTLVIWALNDPTATIERGHLLFKAIAEKERQAEMHVFNKSGHFVYREYPKEFNALLKSWVSRYAN